MFFLLVFLKTYDVFSSFVHYSNERLFACFNNKEREREKTLSCVLGGDDDDDDGRTEKKGQEGGGPNKKRVVIRR